MTMTQKQMNGWQRHDIVLERDSRFVHEVDWRHIYRTRHGLMGKITVATSCGLNLREKQWCRVPKQVPAAVTCLVCIGMSE